MTKKCLRIAVLVLLIVLALAFLLLVSINQLLVANKARIEQLVSKELSASVRFAGIELILHPVPEFRVDQFQITDQEGCRVPLGVEGLQVRFSLTPLLKRRIELSSITLIAPTIDLTRDSQGLRLSRRKGEECQSAEEKKKQMPPDKSETSTEAADDSSSSPDFEIALKKIEMKGGRFHFRSPTLDLSLPELSFSARVPETGDPLKHSARAIDQTGYLHLTKLNYGFSVKTNLSAKGIRIRDQEDYYSTDLVRGSLSMTYGPEKGTRFSSALQVENFGYGFEGFSIEKVSAALDNIRGSISKQTDVVVDLELDGKSIILKHPAITISAVKAVRAPVRVKVPASGGYEVSGPVTVEGGKIHVLGQNLEEVTSTVQMLVSPKQEYSTDKLAFKMQGKPLVMNTRVTITSEAYSVRDTELKLGAGKIGVTTELLRDGSKRFSGNAGITDIKLQELVSLFSPKNAEEFSGSVNSFNADFNGQTDKPTESLSAKGSFILQSKVLRKRNAMQRIFDVVTKVPPFNLIKYSSKDDDQSDQTLQSDFRITDRQVLFENSKLKHPRFTLKGEGIIGFDKKVDFRAKLVLFEKTAGSLGLGVKSLRRLFGGMMKVNIPLIIEGELPEPDIKVDKKGLLRQRGGEKQREPID